MPWLFFARSERSRVLPALSNNIGNVLYDQGKLAEAEQYYRQVLRIDRDLSDKAGAAGALGNLAMCGTDWATSLEPARCRKNACRIFRI